MSPPTWPVSIKGIVMIDGKVVMLRNERDEWELPGGRLELDESPEACVAREIREELGITVEVQDLVDVWVYPVLPDRSVVVVTYGCRATDSLRPVMSDEHVDLCLIAIDELEQHAMPQGYRSSIRAWIASSDRAPPAAGR